MASLNRHRKRKCGNRNRCSLATDEHRFSPINQESRKSGKEPTNFQRCCFSAVSWIRGFQILFQHGSVLPMPPVRGAAAVVSNTAAGASTIAPFSRACLCEHEPRIKFSSTTAPPSEIICVNATIRATSTIGYGAILSDRIASRYGKRITRAPPGKI